MKRIIEENDFQKVVENENGTVSIFEKQKGEIKKVVQNENGTVSIFEKQKGEIKKQGGYFKLSKKHWFDDWAVLTWAQRSIMVSLWLYGGGTGQAWVSMRALAGQLNVHKETILRNIKKLEKLKFLKIKKGRGRGRHFNIYILLK